VRGRKGLRSRGLGPGGAGDGVRVMAAARRQMMCDDFDKRHQFDALLRHFAQVSPGQVPSADVR